VSGREVFGLVAQQMSWITIDDLLAGTLHSLTDDSIHEPVNAVTPCPVTNRESIKTLGSLLRRPTILPTPAFAARMLLGEMADTVLLASTRVVPAVLRAGKFEFMYPDLDMALQHVLDRPGKRLGQ